jgi:hypothetical protein
MGWDDRLLRGDIHGPWEQDLYGERWFDFDHAAIELGDKLAIPPGAAHVQLHKLCASGVIRSIGGDKTSQEEPKPIPPSAWGMISLHRMSWLAISTSTIGSIGNQLIRLAASSLALLGCLQRCTRQACPSADCPREPLRAALLARDPSLKPLNLTTLKTAIDALNRQVRNAPNVNVSN